MTDVAVALLMMGELFGRRHAIHRRCIPAPRPAPAAVAAPPASANPYECVVPTAGSGLFRVRSNACNPMNVPQDDAGARCTVEESRNGSPIAIARLAADDEVILGSPRGNPDFVTSIALRNGRLTGEDVSEIAAVPHLESLELDHVDFSAVDLSSWRQLARLKNVTFIHCKFVEAELRWLRDRPLECVVLDTCYVDVRTFRALAQLKIAKLSLQSQAIERIVLDELKAIRSIRAVECCAPNVQQSEPKLFFGVPHVIDELHSPLQMLFLEFGTECEGRKTEHEPEWLAVLGVQYATFVDGERRATNDATFPSGVDAVPLSDEPRSLFAEPDAAGDPGVTYTLSLSESPEIAWSLAHEETNQPVALHPRSEFFPGRAPPDRYLSGHFSFFGP